MSDSIARMGEIIFSKPEAPILRALGLGSCIGLCLFDPRTKTGCLAHVMLPEAKVGATDVGKYADTAVPFVINQLHSRGVSKSRLRAAIVGGAQLFNFENAGSCLDVGRRNIEAVRHHLGTAGIQLLAEDVGGRSGRTVLFDSSTGDVTVKTVGGTEQKLVNLS